MARRKNEIATVQINAKAIRECPPIEEAFDNFLKEQKLLNRSPRTLEWHKENFNALKKAFKEQNIPFVLQSITLDHIKYNFMLYTMETYGNKPTTVNNRVKTYKAFWSFLVKEGFLETDITSGLIKVKEKKKVIIALDETEIISMFKTCNTKTYTGLRDLTMMKLLFDTGIRLCELVKIKVQDISFKDNMALIDGKGQKERFVPISSDLKKVLRDYLTVRGNTDSDALFLNIDNLPIKRRTVQDRLADIKKEANVKKQASPHIWRHTFAKFYILNGGDPFTLKKILGHADWEMVHRGTWV